MSQKCGISFIAFTATMILLVSAMNVMSLFALSQWVGVSIGGGAFIVMLIMLIPLIKRTLPHFVALTVNAVASGIAASSLFVYLGEYPPVLHTYLLVLAYGGIFAIYCLLTNIGFCKRHYVISMLVFLAIVITANILLAVMCDYAIFKLSLLCLIPFIAFLITIISNADGALAQIKTVAYYSFAALILIVIAVIIVISQGDGLDGLGDGLGGAAPARKKKNPYNYSDL